MKKKIHFFIAAVMVIAILNGCGYVSENTADRTDQQKAQYDWLPKLSNNHEIFLYDKFSQRIITYDAVLNKVIQRNDTPNYFQFEFNDLATNVYTAGHSLNLNFKIIKIGKDKISTLYQADVADGIFPLAYRNSEQMYFLKCTYNKSGEELYGDRVICSFSEKTKKLTEIPSTKGMRSLYGTLIKNTLYFTVYDENTDRFELYSLDRSGKGTPTLLLKDLISGEIYNHNGTLWVSDNSTIYTYEDHKASFPKKSLNYFFLDRLFQIGPNAQGDLELLVTNLNTGNLEADINGIVDVRASGNKISVYTYKGIVNM